MGLTAVTETAAASASIAKPRVSVVVVEPAVGVSYAELAAGASAVSLAASASSISLVATSQYQTFLVAAEIDISGYNRFTPEATIFVYDATAINFSTAFTSSFGVGDLLRVMLTPNPKDTIALSDYDVWAFTKGLSESIYAQEYVNFSIQRPLFDSAIYVDSAALGVSKPLTDAVSFADNLTKLLTYQRTFADGFAVDDEADVDDGLTIQVVRVLSNVVFPTDTTAKEPQLGKSDSISLADSGNVFLQSYCDRTYFAEDYVGSYRFF